MAPHTWHTLSILASSSRLRRLSEKAKHKWDGQWSINNAWWYSEIVLLFQMIVYDFLVCLSFMRGSQIDVVGFKIFQGSTSHPLRLFLACGKDPRHLDRRFCWYSTSPPCSTIGSENGMCGPLFLVSIELVNYMLLSVLRFQLVQTVLVERRWWNRWSTTRAKALQPSPRKASPWVVTKHLHKMWTCQTPGKTSNINEKTTASEFAELEVPMSIELSMKFWCFTDSAPEIWPYAIPPDSCSVFCRYQFFFRFNMLDQICGASEHVNQSIFSEKNCCLCHSPNPVYWPSWHEASLSSRSSPSNSWRVAHQGLSAAMGVWYGFCKCDVWKGFKFDSRAKGIDSFWLA